MIVTRLRPPGRRTLDRRQMRKRQRGQSLAEFAFVFPVIAMLAFGFIDIGRAVYEYNTLTAAARQGSRVAAVSQLDPETGPWRCQANRPVESLTDPNWTFRGCAISAGVSLGLQGSDILVTYAAPPDTDLECTDTLNVGCIATVTVVHEFMPITPVAGVVIGTISMTSTSEMPIERLYP